MKKFVLIAAVVALSACSQKPADTAAADAPTATTEAAATAAWTGFEPGAYVVTDAAGKKADYVLTADGYTAKGADGKTETGTLVMKDGKGCMTPKGGKEMCWTNAAPGPDGTWTAVADDGTKATIMRKPA